ncbi:MAG: hypothetical protein DSO07_05125 [Thermoproteota archaeon]|nr:MAG: hypothetical protein DSO07_05125 [Candidatus Korarchaeota archaeon]
MPVRIAKKLKYQGSVTPSALNTETDIINLSTQSDDFILEGQISLQNLASGDTVVVRIYIAVDGTNRVKSDEMTFNGPVSIPVLRIPATTLAANTQPRITVTQTAGTLRAIPYSFIVQVMETI